MRPILLLCSSVLAGLLGLIPPAHAQSQLVLAISEGTSGGLDHGRVISKYQDFANVSGKAIQKELSD